MGWFQIGVLTVLIRIRTWVFILVESMVFKWGERPFHGKMSEVRVWSVARTENPT